MTALLSAASLNACKGIELENRIEQIEGYTEPVVMIVAANERNRYKNNYSSEIWDIRMEDDGEAFDEVMIQNVKSFMQDLKTMCMLAEERGLDVSSQERDTIRKMSEEYYFGLSAADREYIGCSIEDVQSLYTDYFTANKLVEQLTASSNSEISDSEAKVIRLEQIVTEDLKKATAILKKVKIDGADFEAMASRYTEDEVIELTLERGKNDSLYEKTAFSLESGQISNILGIDGKYYLIKCVSDYDEEATAERKEKLQTAMENRSFETFYIPYKKEHKVVFSEKFWNDIDLKKGEDSSVENFFDIYEKYI